MKHIISIEDFEKILGKRKVNKYVLVKLYRFFYFHRLNDLYNQCQHLDGIEFITKALNLLNIKIDTDPKELQLISKNKQVIFISNHPFGLLDGMILLKIICSIKIDCKLIVHSVLKKIVPLNKLFLFVKPMKNKKDFKLKFQDARSLLSEISTQHSVILFPAGKVACFRNGVKVRDQAWDRSSLKLICSSNLPIIPIYIKGRNSLFFSFLNTISVNIGFLFLIREFFKKEGKTITVRIGHEILLPNSNIEEANDLLRKKLLEELQ